MFRLKTVSAVCFLNRQLSIMMILVQYIVASKNILKEWHCKYDNYEIIQYNYKHFKLTELNLNPIQNIFSLTLFLVSCLYYLFLYSFVKITL